MQKDCGQCQANFEIEDRDQEFYKKMKVPPPTLCPDCRLQRRLAWRVERNLYMRKCDLTGKHIMSIFPQDHPNPVYHHEEWYTDKFNPLEYGRDFDFSRPFFDQFKELLATVPLFSLNVLGLQNCDYVNQCGWSKNCYFTIEADHNEDCIHCYRIYNSKTCVECSEIDKCERCYECTDCEKCFHLRYSQLCEQCRDSVFLFDCRSCNNCFGCVGLRQKQYHMFNEKLTKEEYAERLKDFDFSNREHIMAAQTRLEELKLKHARKAVIGEQNDNVSGNYIYESKDCSDCFEIRACRDCKYCRIIHHANDCMDYLCWGDNSERMYECQECGHNAHNLRFCSACYDGLHSLTYCYQCVLTANNCFGCVGMKKNDYCILNKQYEKSEYEELVPKIIEHMEKTEEWGEFFPAELSPHSYNETMAQEVFPLDKDGAVSKGLKWQDNLPSTTGKETITWDKIPEDIADVPDSIIDEVLACEITGKNFRITKQELLFYKTFRIPIPRLHPDVHHKMRMDSRNPRKLWKRECGKCGEEIETTYAPEKQEKVYCEKCYLEEVY